VPDREPLWASSLARQPRAGDDVVATWERDDDDDDDEPSPPPAPAPAAATVHDFWPQAIALGAALFAVLVLVAAALTSSGTLTVRDVSSGWDDVPMTCRTLRLEDGDRALEAFRCHAVGAGRLPPGVYRSPDSQWTSDITRRDALADAMRISRSGVLTGVAVY
jgi:hypothetical protein